MDTKKIERLFLQAMQSSLQNKQVTWEDRLEPDEWLGLFQMAEKHHVLHMVYEAVYCCPAAQKADPQIFHFYKQHFIRSVMMQAMRTNEFGKLFQFLRDSGVHPLVVKGIICRQLYPQPDYRVSGDEDVLVPEEEFDQCRRAMEAFGMQVAGEEQDADTAYEIPYGKPGSSLYVELHKSLFPPESAAYGELNHFFEHVHERAIEIPVGGVPIVTMEYTDHLFYLICHAFKHFLHSGFGIRQVSDICLYSDAYGSKIDWPLVLEECREIHADVFTAALFRIGQKYLTFDPVHACCPRELTAMDVDETEMLEDLLDSGVYGDGSMSRKHSSNITLNAVVAEKQGKKTGSGVLRTVFPSASRLAGRYTYLKKKPYLLPIAWADRILKYRKETSGHKEDNNAAESIKIGNERVGLMRKYGIIK